MANARSPSKAAAAPSAYGRRPNPIPKIDPWADILAIAPYFNPLGQQASGVIGGMLANPDPGIESTGLSNLNAFRNSMGGFIEPPEITFARLTQNASWAAAPDPAAAAEHELALFNEYITKLSSAYGATPRNTGGYASVASQPGLVVGRANPASGQQSMGPFSTIPGASVSQSPIAQAPPQAPNPPPPAQYAGNLNIMAGPYGGSPTGFYAGDPYAQTPQPTVGEDWGIDEGY